MSRPVLTTYSKKKPKAMISEKASKVRAWELVIEQERISRTEPEEKENRNIANSELSASKAKVVIDFSMVSKRNEEEMKVKDLEEIIEGMEKITCTPKTPGFVDLLTIDKMPTPFTPYTPSRRRMTAHDFHFHSTRHDELKSQFREENLASMHQSICQIVEGHDYKLEKIGEASYSEVYGNEEIVIKVIPVVDEDPKGDYPYMLLSNLVHEFWVSEAIPSKLVGFEMCHTGFLKVFKAELCKGPYSKDLLKEWNRFEDEYGTENPSPGSKF